MKAVILAGGFGTHILFAGNLAKQSYMIGRQFRISGTLNNTDEVMHNSFWIGVYLGISQAMLDFMIEKIEAFFGVNFD